jgi:cysteine desulfurase NifS
METKIYMDNAATTKMDKRVLEAMLPYFMENYGNPSSVYTLAGKSKSAIWEAKDIISDSIGGDANEIYFTGSGTESNNWAIKAVAEAYADKGNHIITTKIEHHAVLNTCEYLEQKGFKITYLNVDESGIVDIDELEKAICKDTILISIMYANNEIGTIQPINQIGEIAKKRGVIFHTDAVQAFGHIPINVQDSYIDLMSANAHKINGPKGIGFLYIKQGIKIRSFIHGGAQEHKRRAGTENVPSIVGFGMATKLAISEMENRASKVIQLRDYIIERIEAEIPDAVLRGHRNNRLPNNINFTFKSVESELILILLDMKGICASGGSACTSGSREPSHVLLALGIPYELANTSIRFTISENTKKEEIDTVVEELKLIIK